jgi:hypothetical protein
VTPLGATVTVLGAVFLLYLSNNKSKPVLFLGVRPMGEEGDRLWAQCVCLIHFTMKYVSFCQVQGRFRVAAAAKDVRTVY